jgi:hypothetical protein
VTIIVPSSGVVVVGVAGVVESGPPVDGTSPGAPVEAAPAAPATLVAPERVPAPDPAVGLDDLALLAAPVVAPPLPAVELARLGLLAPSTWVDGPF